MTKLSPSAVRFIRKENAYLRARSQTAAQRFLADMSNVRRFLDDYPLAGAELELLRGTSRDGLRRWVKGDYTFDYRIKPDGEPLVVLVRHHAQDDPHQPFESDDLDQDYD